MVKCDAFAGWSWKSRGPVNLLDIERFQCLSQVTAIIFVLQFDVAKLDFDPGFRDGIKNLSVVVIDGVTFKSEVLSERIRI